MFNLLNERCDLFVSFKDIPFNYKLKKLMHFVHRIIFIQKYREGGANLNALGEKTKSTSNHIILVKTLIYL